jgi:benzylsuccinate CoA-transferase BbsF subunit
LGPFLDDEAGINRSVSYHNFNAGKRSVAVDLKHPDAGSVLHPLIRWADVVVESFAPGVAGRLGLDEPGVRAVRHEVIMVSTSIGGVEWGGGVGTMGAAICGATHLMGEPDSAPLGPFGPWTDEVAPRYIAISILAALRRRAATGRGSYIDVSQAEAGIQFLLPAVYQQAFDGVTPMPRPADLPDPWRCPANAYECAEGRWIAIDGSSDKSFESLRAMVGGDLLDERYTTLLGRLACRGEVDLAISNWTREWGAAELERQLQAHGVPAHVASSTTDLGVDDDLRVSMLTSIDLPEGRACDVVRRSFRWNGQLDPVRRGPRLGEHTDEVLRDVCGLDDVEIARLREARVLT